MRCCNAGLRFLNVSLNSLQLLPDGLALQYLTRLRMNDNPLRLTCTDVDSLLARLPRLAVLEDWGTASASHVRSYAACSLPVQG